MSKYNKTILTNSGLDLAARASSGKAKFTITRAATSTEKLADKSISELQQLTALPSLMQYGEINNVADSAQDKSIVIGTELVFNNKDLTTGYNVNTIGLFAKEEATNKEILYALTTAVEPEMMPDFTTSTRCIYGTSNYRPNFQRLITDYDYKNIMGYVDSKEVVHQCDDLDSGIAYSKAHPNVFVATP